MWAHNKLNRTCKDDPTGHRTRGEKERRTERKRWRDYIKEWTDLKLGDAFRKAEDREGWRKVVV